MITSLNSILTNVIFTFGFICGVQLPEFIQQYKQRLSGHVMEAKYQLSQFQQIADSQYQGNLLSLINKYINNNDEAIKKTGELIQSQVQRTDYLETQLQGLTSHEYPYNIISFVQTLDIEIASLTLKDFVLAIPLTTNALITGFCFALALIVCVSSIIWSLKSLWMRLFSSPQTKRALT